jgi:hypothetical protein
MDWSTLKVPHLDRLQPYLQTLDQAGKVCQGQTLQLITKVRKLWTKKFYNIGPWLHYLSLTWIFDDMVRFFNK